MSPSMTSQSSSAGIAPMPPQGDLQVGPTGGGQAPGQGGPLAALLAGIAPIKADVDAIVAAAQRLGQTMPGAQAICAQIISQATQLLPMAAQSMLAPGPAGPTELSAPPMGAPPQDLVGQGF